MRKSRVGLTAVLGRALVGGEEKLDLSIVSRIKTEAFGTHSKVILEWSESGRRYFLAQSARINAQAFFMPPAMLPPSLVFDKRSPSLLAICI